MGACQALEGHEWQASDVAERKMTWEVMDGGTSDVRGHGLREERDSCLIGIVVWPYRRELGVARRLEEVSRLLLFLRFL